MALVPPDKALIDRLPLPLAQLYRRAANAKTSLERHQAAYYWWEASLKLLASAAVVVNAKNPDPDPKLKPLLTALARPQIGHWWALARELSRSLSAAGDLSFQKVATFLFSDRRDDLPHLAGLDAALADVPARSVVRPADVFDHLVAYRNKMPGHGAIGMHHDAHYERMAAALRAALEELFRHLDPLAGRQLIYVRDVKQSASRWLVERFALHGESPEARSGLDLPRDIGSELPHDNRVYLQASADESTAGLTAYHPFGLFDFESCRFSFWNSRRSPTTVQYLCYTTGEVANVTADESVSIKPVGADADGNVPSVEATDSGRPTLGEFALLSELGRGGMGVVYRAWQPSLRREVALKTLLRVGDATADARFRREIRALGKVDHPNLVKVHTSGADGDRWFYAMELVEGASLAAIAQKLSASGVAAGTVDGAKWQAAVSTACDEAREAEKPLNGSPPRQQGSELKSSFAGAADSRNANYVDQVTDLIRQAAEAVNALHDSGVVHRDIKPGNILIDDTGKHAVLMDLGLAQLEDDAEAKLTKTRQFLGTPRYASPEHVLGVSRLDRCSDVYSLGATLWEMLALRPIFDADDSLPTNQVFERIQRDEPERLRRINRAVSRDLEAVVHKCLEKNPKARYANAAEFAAELRRNLNREPVTARPVSGTTRALKWLRRRPAIAAALTLGLVLLVGGVVGTIVFSAKSRQLANANVALEESLVITKAARKRTREALDAMVSGITGDSLATQKELSVEQKKFLESVVGYYEEFAAEPGEDREGRERLAKALVSLGVIRYRLGQHAEGRRIFERATQQYLALAAEFPTAPEYQQGMANNQNSLGAVLYKLGLRSGAETAYRAALGIQEKLAADYPAMPEYRKELARSHNNLGILLRDLNQPSGAATAYRSALIIQEKLTADYPDVQQYQQELAVSHNNLGNVFNDLGQRSDAVTAYRAALAIQAKLAADYPTVPGYRQDLARSHNNLGNMLKNLDQGSEAAMAYRAALRDQEKLAADYPAVPAYREEVARTHYNLGNLLRDLGQRSEAVTAYRAALVVRERLAADYPAVPEYRQDLAANHNNLGIVLRQLSLRSEAVTAYRAALVVREKLAAEYPAVPEYRQGLARTYSNLGSLLRDFGQWSEALAAYRSAQAVQEKLAAEYQAVPAYRRELASTLENLGNVLANLSQRSEAVTALRAAVEIREKLAADHPAVPNYRQDLAKNHHNLGYLLNLFGQRSEAVTAYRAALAIFERLAHEFSNVPQYRAEQNSMQLALAGLLTNSGQAAEAAAIAESIAAEMDKSVDLLYKCSCALSLAAAAPSNPDADKHAGRAVELLRQAMAKGYRNFAQMMKDPDLSAIRGREDFAALLWDWADAPAKP
jgi:serine/threonine protein kinase